MSYDEKRQQVDELQQKINSYGELSGDVKKKINYKFRLDWNYYSNSMEGNTLTMEETRSVMVGNLTVGGKPIKDVLEIKGHDEVISDILRIGKSEVRLSETRIRDIHKAIMYEEDETKKQKVGKWKTDPNYLYNYKEERFDFVSPADVPERMHELLNKTNAAIDAIQQRKKDAPHPLDVALQFHLDYVLIHPFYDGNGRTARILTNLLLISFGYPPFWVNTGERRIYNQYIGDIQGYGGSPDLFFDFAAGLVIRSQQLVLDAVEGISIDEPYDIEKEISLWKKQLNNKKEAQLKSDDQIAELFIKCLNALLEEYRNKMKTSFGDLFAKWEELGMVNGSNVNHLGLDYVITRVNRMIKEFEKKKVQKITKATYSREEIEIHTAGIKIDMTGFRKDGVNTFNIFTDLTIEFQDFKYIITTNGEKKTEKLYSELVDADERAEIVSAAIKDTFKRIKLSFKNPPLSELLE